MKQLAASIVLLLFSFNTQAENLSIDQKVDQMLQPIADVFTSIVFYTVNIGGVDAPLIVMWLILAAVVFTSYFGFINIRGFSHSCRVIRGDFSDPNDPGETTHFQALATAISGTVGLGNIAGVAIAVSIGGPGATFWMMLAGFLGMSTKFLECTLGVKYRHINAAGEVRGGPMYYLGEGLSQLGHHKSGKVLAYFFAVCCIVASLCGSNMLQANQAYQQFVSVLGSEQGFWANNGWVFGTILAVIIGVVIIGGIKSIAKVTEKVVPLMAGIYLSAALFILAYHYAEIPHAFSLIIEGAFNPTGVVGGMIGVMLQGFKRSAFSSEAGMGAASIAHATAATKEPVREGYVALIEPFIDTVVICTITALVIVITGSYQNVDGISGVTLTSNAFASVIWWFPYVLSVCVLLFAISTMISWAYYGSIAWAFVFGESKKLAMLYKLIFCSATIIGASASLGAIIAISDSAFFSMAIANIIGLYLLAPQVKRDLKKYQKTYCENK